MEISNKTLAMFLVAAIVASLAGTMISLNKIGTLDGPTGYAFSNTSGNVSIDVSELVAIRLVNSDLAFTGCTGNSSGENTTVTSNNFGSEWVAAGTAGCNQLNAAQANTNGITITNDGNVNVNITFNSSNTGQASNALGTMLTSSNPSYEWSEFFYDVNEVANVCISNMGGADNTYGSWVEVTDISGNQYMVCDNMSTGPESDQVHFHVNITIPPFPANAQSDTNLTFIACKSGGAC